MPPRPWEPSSFQTPPEPDTTPAATLEAVDLATTNHSDGEPILARASDTSPTPGDRVAFLPADPDDQVFPARAAESEPAGRAWPLRAIFALGLAIEAAWGLASLTAGLAVLASLPILNFLAFGYVLEAAGRPLRTNRYDAAFPGIRRAARLGAIIAIGWLMLLPARALATLRESAWIIDPTSPAVRNLSVALAIYLAFAGFHYASACWAGGRLRDFLTPRPFSFPRQLLTPAAWVQARDRLWLFVDSLRLGHCFWLGLRGFAGSLIWLIIPAGMMAGAAATGNGPGAFFGGLLLAIVALYLPFVQARFAAENRFRAFFEVSAVRELFRRAPLLYLGALAATLALAVPLYLLKIEITPREAAWLPGLFFIVFMLPTRWLVGWALLFASRREHRRSWFLRQPVRLLMLAGALFYALMTWVSQFTSWYGAASFLEQHAFLLPAPFLRFN
jgi:hypothetical protein